MISDANGLIVTDCIKDDKELTIGLAEEDEPKWEFELLNESQYPLQFYLRWSEFD